MPKGLRTSSYGGSGSTIGVLVPFTLAVVATAVMVAIFHGKPQPNESAIIDPATTTTTTTTNHSTNINTIEAVRHGLIKAAGAAYAGNLTYVVGLNAAVDLIVPATELLSALKLSAPSSPPHPNYNNNNNNNNDNDVLNEDGLDNLEALRACFAHHFSAGTAAERTFTDSAAYGHIVSVARSLSSSRVYPGGNAALIGDHILATPAGMAGQRRVVLVANVGPVLANLLPKNMEVAQEMKSDQDEVHLILEYAKGEKWGTLTAPRANRFIFSHDRTNAELRPLDGFRAALDRVQGGTGVGKGKGENKSNNDVVASTADVLVVSGVHQLASEPESLRQARVDKLVEFLDSVDSRLPVHLELACIEDAAFMALLASKVLSKVDSLGLNEQELAALAAAVPEAPHHALLARDGLDIPEVGLVADVMGWILSKFGSTSTSTNSSSSCGGSGSAGGAGGGGNCSSSSSSQDGRRLSRVHFHSLTFHLLATRRDFWADSEAAAATGATTCSARACESPELDPKRFDLLFPPTYRRSMLPSTLGRSSSDSNSASGSSSDSSSSSSSSSGGHGGCNNGDNVGSSSSQSDKLYYFNPETPVTSWQGLPGIDFSLAPVLVCKKPTKTVGLGDSISAAGLDRNRFLKK